MQTTTPVEIRHFHLFCGLGGGARGFNRASPRVGNLQAKFRCLGGIDVDPASIRDFGRLAVADPRRDGPCFGKYAVTPYGTHAGTVISGSTTGQGAFAVADPRSGMDAERTAYTTGGHYGVVPWDSQAGAVSGAACHDNGRWSVADPRMPAAADKLVCRIVSEDGTWHRPFTTLELAHLQSLVEPDELLELDGTSDQAKRERIGNAVPSEAGEGIAHVMGETLLLAWSGETFILSAQPVWVRPIALGLAMGATA